MFCLTGTQIREELSDWPRTPIKADINLQALAVAPSHTPRPLTAVA